jgi:hypothetical protein
MQQYITKMIFRIISGDGSHTPQFDEQLIFVSAKSKIEAFENAKRIGSEREDSYVNDDNELVQWKFIGVEDLHEIKLGKSGVELYSSLREVDDPQQYISMVQFKELSMRQRHLFGTEQFV